MSPKSREFYRFILTQQCLSLRKPEKDIKQSDSYDKIYENVNKIYLPLIPTEY